MKKLLCLFSAVLFALTSCSNNDDNSSDKASSILVKKISYPKNDGSVYTETIVYDGNKIVSLTGDDYMIKYTYIGSFITKSEEFDEKGVLDYTNEYTYTNGKLTISVEKGANSSSSYKTKYVYNADGTVSYEGFTVVSGVEQKNGNDGKYTYKDGNLIKDEESDEVTLYEYDNKNHPYKNALGFNLFLGDDAASSNNVIKETRTSGSGANVYTSVTTSVYKYDVNNFPLEKVESRLSGGSTSTETTQYAY